MVDSDPSETPGTVTDPNVVGLRAQPTVAVRLVRPFADLDIGALFGAHLGRVFECVQAMGAQPAGPPYARYFTFGPDVCDMEIGVPVAVPGGVAVSAPGSEEVGASDLPGGPAVMVELRGPYAALGLAYQRLDDWFAETGRGRGGAPWESYVAMPDTVPDPSELRTELYWPVD